MTGMFLGLWTRLAKRSLLLWTYGAVLAAAALITTVVVVSASEGNSATAGLPGPPGTSLTPGEIVAFDGQLLGLANAVVLLGIVAVVVAAGQMAGEYATGTLRNLLVREPRRWRLLLGWWLGVSSFLAGAVLLASVVAGLAAQLVATGRGFDTSQWYTADGLASSAQTVGLTLGAIVGYGTIGTALGVVLRAPIPAIGIGVGWLLALELALAQFVDGLDKYLPGQLLGAVAAGGTESLTLGQSTQTIVTYLVGAAALTTFLFTRRDVTA